MSRPLLHALAARRPSISVRAAGPPGLVELLKQEGGFDGLERWPEDRAGVAALIRGVRDWKPDAALVLPPSFSSALAARRTGAPRRIGFAADLRSPLLTDAWRRPPRGDLHLGAEYLALLTPLERAHPGFADRAGPVAEGALTPSVLPIEPGAREAARELRSSLGLGSARLALIAPGALYGPAKRWSAERYAALGRGLERQGFRVAVIGTDAERAACDEVASSIGDGTRSLAGRTPLATLAALAAEAALAVSNDSGFAHLAAAVGAPTVVIFGSTSSAWTAPLGPRVRVIQRAPVCSPCFQRRCHIGYRCLEAIEVARVEAECVASAA